MNREQMNRAGDGVDERRLLFDRAVVQKPEQWTEAGI